MEKKIKEFLGELKHYCLMNNIKGFKTEVIYDQEDDFFFIKHNDKNIRKTEFYKIVCKKINDHFFSKSIMNICFHYDYKFDNKCKMELESSSVLCWKKAASEAGVKSSLFSKKIETVIFKNKFIESNLADDRVQYISQQKKYMLNQFGSYNELYNSMSQCLFEQVEQVDLAPAA